MSARHLAKLSFRWLSFEAVAGSVSLISLRSLSTSTWISFSGDPSGIGEVDLLPTVDPIEPPILTLLMLAVSC